MKVKNIFILCPNCKKSTTTDFQDFLISSVFKCPGCKADIVAGKDGIGQQIKHYIENKQVNIAIYMHRVVTGDSLSKSKLYVQNLSNSMGIQMKTGFGFFGIFIFSLIAGFILTFIFSYFYPKVVYLISNDLLGLKIRGVTTVSFFLAVLFYSFIIFLLLLIRRFFRRQKQNKHSGQIKIVEQNKETGQIKIPEQKDFRGNAF